MTLTYAEDPLLLILVHGLTPKPVRGALAALRADLDPPCTNLQSDQKKYKASSAKLEERRATAAKMYG